MRLVSHQLILLLCPLILVLHLNNVFAASCCGGSTSNSGLITNDDLTQFRTSYSFSETQTFVTDQNLWIPDRSKSQRILSLGWNRIFWDRFQWSIETSIIENHHLSRGSSSAHQGDSQISFGYEALPEYNFSEWKPIVYIYSRLTAPTGISKYESGASEKNAVTGQGVWSMSFGFILLRSFGPLDLVLDSELIYGFSRQFNSSGKFIKPGEISRSILKAGWNHANWRLGFNLVHLIELPSLVKDQTVNKTSQRSLLFPQLNLAYLISPLISTSVAYTRESLLGIAQNTYLNDIFSVGITLKQAR